MLNDYLPIKRLYTAVHSALFANEKLSVVHKP